MPYCLLSKVCVCTHAFVNFVSTLFLDLVRAHPLGMPSVFRVFPTWGEAHSVCRLLKAPGALLWCVSRIYFSVFNVIIRKDFLTSRLCKCSSMYGNILITFFSKWLANFSNIILKIIQIFPTCIICWMVFLHIVYITYQIMYRHRTFLGFSFSLTKIALQAITIVRTLMYIHKHIRLYCIILYYYI